MTEKINIGQFDMVNEKVIHTMHLYIELADHYFRYSGKYVASQPVADDPDDHTMGWHEVNVHFDFKIKRECIVSLEKNWLLKREIYDIEIDFLGYAGTVKLYFERAKDMLEVYHKLDEYIFGPK
jgi:hypothetical protein